MESTGEGKVRFIRNEFARIMTRVEQWPAPMCEYECVGSSDLCAKCKEALRW